MPMPAGRFRHRVRIERKVTTQIQSGEFAGSMVESWVLMPGCEAVPAMIEPLKGQEYIASQAMQSKISSKVIVRYMKDLDSTVRLIQGSIIFSVEGGWMVDKKYGLEYLTAYVSQGVNQGQ